MGEEEGLFPPSNPSSLSPQPESADNDQIRGKVEEGEKEKEAAKILCPIKARHPPLTKPRKEQGQQEGRTIIALHQHKTVAPFILVMIT